MVEAFDHEAGPRRGGVTTLALARRDFLVVGSRMARRAILKFFRNKGDLAVLRAVHVRVAFLARNFDVTSDQRESRGGVVERRNHGPPFRGVARSARFV